MKKILAIMLLGLSMGISADVLDSEKTDYEYEGENCVSMNIENCLTVPSVTQRYQSATIPLLFNPRLNSGYYRFDTSWYWQHTGIRFFNPRYR